MLAPIRPTPTKPILEDFIRTKLSYSARKGETASIQAEKMGLHGLLAILSSGSCLCRSCGCRLGGTRAGACPGGRSHPVMVHHRSTKLGRFDGTVTGGSPDGCGY